MRAVCGDALNPSNRPTPEQARELGIDGVRLVYFDDPAFVEYYYEIKDAGFQVAVVLTGESFPDENYGALAAFAASQLVIDPPELWLLGNEPSATRDAASSWAMTPQQYLQFWNDTGTAIRAVLPTSALYVGGMLGPSGWLNPIWSALNPKPRGIDVHYPDSETELLSWGGYLVPLACMEWCWAGPEVRQEDVVGWQRMLDRNTTSNAWFVWSWDEDMSLISPTTGERKPAYDHYHAALRA